MRQQVKGLFRQAISLLLALSISMSTLGMTTQRVYAQQTGEAGATVEQAENAFSQDGEDELITQNPEENPEATPEDDKENSQEGKQEGEAPAGENNPDPEKEPENLPEGELPEEEQQPAAPPENNLVTEFFLGEEQKAQAEIPNRFALTSDFSGVQGPYWYYMILNSHTGNIEPMTKFEPANARWISDIHGNHWMRIFADGFMPTNKENSVCDCEVVLQWKAPLDGKIKISAEDLIKMETQTANRDGVLLSVWHNDTRLWPEEGQEASTNPYGTNGVEFPDIFVDVSEGDSIYFNTNKNIIPNNDRVFWKPVIEYTQEEADYSTVTVTAGENGSVEPGGEVKVETGKSKTFTFKPASGYYVSKVLLNGQEVDTSEYTGNTYTIAAVEADTTLEVFFTVIEHTGGTTYYVDAKAGDDSNNGTSEETPWQSLDKINATTFNPGDKILLKSGSIWNGLLWPKGEGAEGNPITLGKYGTEAYPIINGTGICPMNGSGSGDKMYPTVFLMDQSYWIIENLEITNQNLANKYKLNFGVLIWTTGTTGERMKDVTVRNCYVHDVISDPSTAKMSGGIIGTGTVDYPDGTIAMKSSDYSSLMGKVGFDGLYFVDNHVKNVAKEGVRTTGSGDNSPFRNRKPHLNVVVRGNWIEEVYGDGIVMAEISDGGLCEYNVIKNHCNFSTVNYAGMWDWYASNTTFRYNEVFGGTYGYNDGEAFDFDLGSSNVVFEYNLSHHNRGGLLLTMQGQGTASLKNIFRYNISINDGKESQELFHVAPTDLAIYNNTMYIGKGFTTSIFDNGAVGNFKNNIILAHGDVPKFGRTGAVTGGAGVTNNIFYPASIMKVNGFSEEVLANNIFENPRLSSPQAFTKLYAEGYDLDINCLDEGYEAFVEGMRERASYLKLTENSPAINAGVKIAGAPAEDFFGNPIVGNPDIGAHEFANDPGPKDTDSDNDATEVRLDRAAIYLKEGYSDTITATVLPSSILDRGATFESSNSAVATVTQSGKVTGVSEGTAIITVRSSATPGVYAQCTVIVEASGAVVIKAAKDTFVRDNGSTNTGDGLILEVKKDAAGYNRKAIIGFDIGTWPTVYESVSLEFKVNSVPKDIDVGVNILAGNNWNESGLKWNDVPSVLHSLPTIKVPSTAGMSWVSVDLTDYINSIDKNSVSAISAEITSLTVMQNNDPMVLASRESGEGARLVFSFTDDLEIESPVVRTVVGVEPQLPSQVNITKAGVTEAKDVIWEAIAPEQYSKTGVFVATGRIDGISRFVVATVQVLADYPIKAEVISLETPLGTQISLPATVACEMASGESKMLPVTWDNIPESAWQKLGSFKVNGIIDDYQQNYFATITITQAVVTSVEDTKVTAFVGYAPVMPSVVSVRYSDGSKGTADVVWEAISPESYQQAGSFEVEGSTQNGMQAKATVTVVEIISTEAVEIKNPQGKYPALPSWVNANTGNSVISVNVVWETVPASQYTGTQSYTVKGYVAGTHIEVTANVTQTSPIEKEAPTYTVIEDTYLRLGKSSQTNGSETLITPKGYTGDYKRDGLFKFRLDADVIEDLTSLTLSLPVASLDKLGTGYCKEYWFAVYANSSSWNEATASWDGVSQAAGYKKALIQAREIITTDDIGRYVDVDVSEALAYIEMSPDGKYGYISFLIAIDENPADSNDGQNGGINFYSKENSINMPALLKTSNKYVTEIENIEISVEKNEMPVLPQTVKITYSDGSVVNEAVKWDSISAELLAVEGSFLVRGKVSDLYITVTAKITVKPEIEVEFTSIKVNPGSIVSGKAANISVQVTGENLEGRDIAVHLVKDGVSYASTMLNASGKVLLYVEEAPEAGSYQIVVSDQSGKHSIEGSIEILEDSDDIWQMHVEKSDDDMLRISFNTEVVFKNSKVTINGKDYKWEKVDDRTMRIIGADYNTIFDREDNTVVVSGVCLIKYYPSYTFKYTVNLNIVPQVSERAMEAGLFTDARDIAND